ncbi:MAG: phenylalanine--tRNA ligase subunit beta [Gammaproteobacteria bacterium]
MKISESWLREWINPACDTKALAEQLTMAGLEVDGIERFGEGLDHIVVGKVTKLKSHPNADRLSLCEVDVGAQQRLSIVCGASNVQADGIYPVALIGAELPGGLKIEKSKLRGEVSEGMLCSGVELGIAETSEGLYELDAALVPGTPVSVALDLIDQVIDLDLTPNRADCFSVLGVARDLAAINELPFSEPQTSAVAAAIDDTFAVDLQAGESCPVFAGRVIRGIDSSATTPLWIQEHLRRTGIRALHPVVDVTNFVMLELGQPMHGYDLSALKGSITVRQAWSDEQLELLDEQSVKLSDEVLVIADQSGAIGMAGVMGGASTAVSTETRDVFLESAFFSPAAIAGRARQQGLHTDASLRFERGVDPQGQLRALERATALIIEICGGEPGPAVETQLEKFRPRARAVVLRRQRLAKVLGIEVPDERVVSILEGLHMQVTADGEGWRVIPPSCRFDIAIEEDLIEEVGRLFGYDNVPETAGTATVHLTRQTETVVPIERVRSVLVARGYQEVINYSFVAPDMNRMLGSGGETMALSNPISSDLAVMRGSLWPGLIRSLKLNLNRQQGRLRLFESGVRFISQDAEITEENIISGLLWGSRFPEHWDGDTAAADFFDIKSDVEALLSLDPSSAELNFNAAAHPALRPGITARVARDGVPIGWIGEMHPALLKRVELDSAPLLFELDIAKSFVSKATAYREVSKFPSVRRDLALVVDEQVEAADLVRETRAVAGSVLRKIVIFDVYTGKGVDSGRKSVALGLILQETSRTLTDSEVESLITSVLSHLSDKFNAIIRE